MIMMTKSKNNQGKKLKFLTLVPLSAVLLLAVALLNGIFPQQVKAGNPEASVIAPVNIAASSANALPGDTIMKKVIIIKSTCEKKGDKDCDKKHIEFQGKKITTSVDKDSTINIVEVGDNGCVKNIDPDDIETITIKGNDTIIVKCKEIKKGKKEKIIIKTTDSSNDENLLILLDGKRINKEEMDKIDPETIATIDVTKGNEELKKLGYTDDYDGVIKIVTKK